MSASPAGSACSSDLSSAPTTPGRPLTPGHAHEDQAQRSTDSGDSSSAVATAPPATVEATKDKKKTNPAAKSKSNEPSSTPASEGSRRRASGRDKKETQRKKEGDALLASNVFDDKGKKRSKVAGPLAGSKKTAEEAAGPSRKAIKLKVTLRKERESSSSSSSSRQSLQDEIRALGDPEGSDDEDKLPVSTKRSRKTKPATTSRDSKDKIKRSLSASSGYSRTADSDQEMSDLPPSEDEEDTRGMTDDEADFVTVKRRKKSKDATSQSQARSGPKTKPESSSSSKLPSKATKSTPSAKASGVSAPRKPTRAELDKMIASKIKASAAVAGSSSSGSNTPASLSGVRQPSQGQGTPSGAPVPIKRPVKPKGVDMWDSLIGSASKPKPAAVPKQAAVDAKPDKSQGNSDERKEGTTAAPAVATPSSSVQPKDRPAVVSSAPRPLGMSSAASRGPSTANTPNVMGAPSSIRPRPQYYTAPSQPTAIIIHQTPGLNGQHWNKEAYRRQRIQEKLKNREIPLSSSTGTLDLMRPSELVHEFEEEWSRKRRVDRTLTGVKGKDFGAGKILAERLVAAKKQKTVDGVTAVGAS